MLYNTGSDLPVYHTILYNTGSDLPVYHTILYNTGSDPTWYVCAGARNGRLELRHETEMRCARMRVLVYGSLVTRTNILC